MARLRLAAIGTCRVHEPLKVAEQQGRIHLESDPAFGYMHTPQEILQSFDIHNGKALPPEGVPDLLSLTSSAPLDESLNYYEVLRTKIDVLVLEISSLRYVGYNGWCLKFDRIRERLIAEGFPESTRFSTFANGTADMQLMKKLSESDPLLFDVVSNGEFRSYGASELKRKVKKILKVVGKPALLVGHFVTAPPFVMKPIMQREKIRTALSGISKELNNVGFFDPTLLFQEFSATDILRDNGKDNGHYAKNFHKKAADKLIRASSAVFRSSLGTM